MDSKNLLRSPLLFRFSQLGWTKRLFWKGAYNLLASARGADFRCMNFGYEGEGEAPLALEPQDRDERVCLQLYHRVASRVPLEGREVLEVGCGRGGGASYVARYLKARRVVGLDLAARSIALCRRLHDGVPGLEFLPGDAERLPFEPARFDAVLNVESSHCYPHLERFVSEVKRVLRPGGHFLFADLRRDFAPVEAVLRASGLVVIEREDITANVVRALDLDSARRVALSQRVPKLLRRQTQALSAVQGTPLYESLRSGGHSYLRFVLQRPV